MKLVFDKSFYTTTLHNIKHTNMSNKFINTQLEYARCTLLDLPLSQPPLWGI